MRFLVDAQLPRRLAVWLRENGHDVLHTLDLPHGNRTSDAAICMIAKDEGWIVVTKDDDFVQSHILSGQPARLLWIATGNISNTELLALISNILPAIRIAFDSASFVEVGREGLVIHE
jgi:predicted nuclease of predicted toxin-antitoxin system